MSCSVDKILLGYGNMNSYLTNGGVMPVLRLALVDKYERGLVIG